MLFDFHAFSFPTPSLSRHGQQWVLVGKFKKEAVSTLCCWLTFPPTAAILVCHIWELRVLLTFGLGDDMADPQSLAHVMEGLVPRIAPLINVVI